MSNVVIIGNVALSIVHFRGKLLEDMVSHGHQVVAFAPDLPGQASERLAQLGVRYRQIPMQRAGMNPFRDLQSLRALVVSLCQERPDVVLAYTIKPVIYGSIGASIARVPLISSMITGLGYAFSSNSFKQVLVKRLVKVLYTVGLKSNQVLFFQNPDDLREFKAMRLLKPGQRSILINGSGVDLEFYDVRPLPPRPCFLLVARLIAEKGIRDYAAAAEIIRDKYPEVRFLLVGMFDKNPTAIRPEEVESWQRRGVLEFLGRLDDVRPAIAESSVFVLPTFYREGTPRSVLEAMAMGRAIITTDTPGCRETVSHGVNGYLVPPHDPQQLAVVMENFICKPCRIAEMGRASRMKAEEKFDVKAVNSLILANLGLSNETVC